MTAGPTALPVRPDLPERPDLPGLADLIRREAQAQGFAAMGICRPDAIPDAHDVAFSHADSLAGGRNAVSHANAAAGRGNPDADANAGADAVADTDV